MVVGAFTDHVCPFGDCGLDGNAVRVYDPLRAGQSTAVETGSTLGLHHCDDHVSDFSIPIRCLRVFPPDGAKFSEENFYHREAELSIAPGEIGLVLVDVWNYGWGPNPLILKAGFFDEMNGRVSFLERAKAVVLDRIKPALGTARITVAHAPSAPIASRYRQASRGDADANTIQPYLMDIHAEPAAMDWPPTAFVETWNDLRLDRTRNASWLEASAEVKKVMDIPDLAKPMDDELVVLDGDHLHDHLKDRGVKILF